MKRISNPQTSDRYQYDFNDEPIILSKPILDLLMHEPKQADLLALYIFYYSTAKWQRTSQPKATTSYVAQGLGWTEERVQKIKKRLKELQLIEDIRIHTVGNRINGHFIKIHLNVHTTPPSYQGVESPGGNSYIEVYNNKNIRRISKDDITLSMFDNFWELYPKKVDKGKALTSWKKICNKPSSQRPKWKEVKTAILRQKSSERWQNPEFIPNPTTWLNQSRWLDDPKEMKSYKRNNFASHMKPYIIDDGIQYDLGPDGKYHHCVTGEIYIP